MTGKTLHVVVSLLFVAGVPLLQEGCVLGQAQSNSFTPCLKKTVQTHFLP